jgi:isopenicillin N synthase-like dioxygenase
MRKDGHKTCGMSEMNGAQQLVSIGTRENLYAPARRNAGVPVIDIEPLVRGTRRDWARVADEIGRAARGGGCFYIANHGIDASLQRAAYQAADDFFSLGTSEKLDVYIAKSRHHSGYVPVSERGLYPDECGERHYEAFDSSLDLLPHQVRAGDAHLMGPNLWPHLAGFRETTTRYFQAVSRLGWRMCRAFELHLGLDLGYFDSFMNRPTSQLRYLHYLPNAAAGNNDDQNMGAHTDYECFTLLHQTSPALQVLGASGDWLDAPPIDGTYMVNIGDMMEIWTNGAFKSNVHRVRNTGLERRSIPFFVAANYDAKVRPLRALFRNGQEAQYRSLVAGHHLTTQLMRDFAYLRARYESQSLELDFVPTDGNPFEQSKLESVALAA